MIPFRNWTLPTALLVLLGANSSWCAAADKDKPADDKSKANPPTTHVESMTAFLGVMVDDIHPALASHLPGVGISGQGLLVHSVSHDSPAAKGGIKVHDVLMTYDDQKLFSPEQLIKLIASDKCGREVKLGLIREGKQETVTIALGERSIGTIESRAEELTVKRPSRFTWPRNLWRVQPQQTPRTQNEANNHTWNEFDSMTVRKLDKDRFHASISHTDKNGKLKKHEFEGTREEIRKRIEADDDLSPTERHHLLRGLDMHGRSPGLLFMPEDDWSDF